MKKALSFVPIVLGTMSAVPLDAGPRDGLQVLPLPIREEQTENEVVRGTEEPSWQEYEAAVRILEQDPEFGPRLQTRELVTYEPMPQSYFFPGVNPSDAAARKLVTVGLLTLLPAAEGGTRSHEVVAVDLEKREIVRFNNQAPPSSRATSRICGPLSAEQPLTDRGTPGEAEVVWRAHGQELWRMTVVRPSASSGERGSGVELKDIRYKGRPVLARAHTPILNVEYDEDVCGPFRDRVDQENAYNATGVLKAPGIMQTEERPRTIVETRNDRGNYRGVSVFTEGGKLVLLAELSAGWYRYVSEFRFDADGSIQPRFKFDAVHNSCTCEDHNHHVYWRFDFDLGNGQNNAVDVLDGDHWRRVKTEERHLRSEGARAWRVKDLETGFGYELRPGSGDRRTDTFGRGDAWVLEHHSGEIDDAGLGSSKEAKLDRYVTGDRVDGADVVLWYAGHLRHDPGLESDLRHEDRHEETPHVLGPTLRPFSHR